MRGNDSTVQPLALDVHAVARELAVSERTIWSLVKTAGLPHVRIGARVVFRRKALEAWLAEREVVAGAPDGELQPSEEVRP